MLWGGAILMGLAAVFFAEATTWAYDGFVHMITGRVWIALLITPPVFAGIGWITSRKLPGARGSGIPEVIAALQIEDRSLNDRLLGLPWSPARWA